MGSDKNSNLLGEGTFLMGAIFMSNRKTKKECFSRKLFGLPSFQADFVNEVKAGMVLFLFEYEERKLYGVFQATCDGAMNIVPTAFISSGKMFSAQICFKIIWRCHPLTEAEFQDAIKENYYSHNKFNFHLSQTQVYKLLHLFYSKRCCSRDYMVISEPRHPRKNGDKKYHNFRSGEYEPNKESTADLHVTPDFPGNNLGQFVYHKRSHQNSVSATVDMEAASLHPRASLSEQGELLDIVSSTSQSVNACRGNISVTPELNTFYQLIPSSHLNRSSISSATVKKELASYSTGSLDCYPFSRYQSYHCPPDQEILGMPNVYQNVDVSSNPQDASYTAYGSSRRLSALASKDTGERICITNLKDSITGNLRDRMSISNIHNANHPSSPGFNDHYTPDISSSNPGNYMNLPLDVTTSVHSPARAELLCYGHCATTSQSDDNSRGPRYFRLEPNEMVSCSEYEPDNLTITESSFYTSPEKGSLQMLYGSGPSKYQDEDSSSYYLHQDDEYYPVPVTSKFHSESHEKRTSVFLRLSGLQKARAETVVTYNPNMDVTVDELFRHLSSRRKYWFKMSEIPNFKKPTKVPNFKKVKLSPASKNVNEVSDQFVMLDDDKQLDSAESQTTVLSMGEQSCTDVGAENGSTLPFLNFKRRSVAQRIGCGTEIETSNSIKHKRRKLVRPSFDEEDESKKAEEVQNVLGASQGVCLTGNDGESNESVDMAGGIGNGTHAAARNSCGADGASKDHLIEKVRVNVGEHVKNVRSSPALQSDVVKPVELNSEGTVLIEGKSKCQNMQEPAQNLHGCPHFVVDRNNSLGGGCSGGGGKEMEMVNLSRAPYNDNAKIDTTEIASRGQHKFRIMERPFEHFHGGPLFVRIGNINRGIKHGNALHRSASGNEEGQEAEYYSGECRSCSCNLEGSSKSPVCQNSCNAVQGIGTGEQSSNQCLGHAEGIENNQEENISSNLHFAEFDCKNIRGSQGNLVSIADTQEENLSVKAHFTVPDSEITNDSQRNLFSIAVRVGSLSSNARILYSTEASRDDAEEEKIAEERNLGFDSNCKKASCRYLAGSTEGIETARLLSNSRMMHTKESPAGMTVKYLGKSPYVVADNGTKMSHQRPLCAAEDMGKGGLLSRSCTLQTVKPTVNTENHVIPGRRLPEVIDEDERTSSCTLVRAAESVSSGKSSSAHVIGCCEASKTTQQGRNGLPGKLDNSRTMTSHASPETMGILK